MVNLNTAVLEYIVHLPMMVHITQGLRGPWKRKRNPSPLRPCRDCSGRPRQSTRVERGQSASPPRLCPVGQEVGRRAATAPRATPPLNIEKERTRAAAHEMERWVRVTLLLGIISILVEKVSIYCLLKMCGVWVKHSHRVSNLHLIMEMWVFASYSVQFP